MSIEIKVPFPKYEGMEVKKVTADIEKGYSVVEYGEYKHKFNIGDIISSNRFILVYRGVNERGAVLTDLYFLIHTSKCENQQIDVGCGYIEEFTDSTQKQRQILFDALSKKGKKWNDDTKEVYPIEKDILVPESIGIYKNPTSGFGDRLLIGFNNNKQFLGYNSQTNQWMVFTHVDRLKKVQCKLTPCKREELKEGDTAVFIPKEMKDLFEKQPFDTTNYCKILDYQKYVYVIDDEVIETNFDNDAYFWYKVEPL